MTTSPVAAPPTRWAVRPAPEPAASTPAGAPLGAPASFRPLDGGSARHNPTLRVMMTSTPAFLTCGRHRLDLSFPRVMGILNVTPDSFSDGGRHVALDDALRHAERMLAEGAAIIDVGGESTRPGAEAVDRKSTRLNSSHVRISYAVFCLKKKRQHPY